MKTVSLLTSAPLLGLMEGDPLIQFFIPSMHVWILDTRWKNLGIEAYLRSQLLFVLFLSFFFFVSEKLFNFVKSGSRDLYICIAFIFEALLMTFDLRYLSFRKGRINNKRTLVVQGNVNQVRDCVLTVEVNRFENRFENRFSGREVAWRWPFSRFSEGLVNEKPFPRDPCCLLYRTISCLVIARRRPLCRRKAHD